jgi:hypothetical protein
VTSLSDRTKNIVAYVDILFFSKKTPCVDPFDDPIRQPEPP